MDKLSFVFIGVGIITSTVLWDYLYRPVDGERFPSLLGLVAYIDLTVW